MCSWVRTMEKERKKTARRKEWGLGVSLFRKCHQFFIKLWARRGFFSPKMSNYIFKSQGGKVWLCNFSWTAATVVTSDNCGEEVNANIKLAQVKMSHKDSKLGALKRWVTQSTRATRSHYGQELRNGAFNVFWTFVCVRETVLFLLLKCRKTLNIYSSGLNVEKN